MSASDRHTPGPWEWGDRAPGYDDESFVVEALDAPALVGADGEPVLSYAGCGSHAIEVRHPDAALLAAAPRLLEALREVVDLATGGERGWDKSKADSPNPAINAKRRRCAAAIVTARAAIAAATGEGAS